MWDLPLLCPLQLHLNYLVCLRSGSGPECVPMIWIKNQLIKLNPLDNKLHPEPARQIPFSAAVPLTWSSFYNLKKSCFYLFLPYTSQQAAAFRMGCQLITQAALDVHDICHFWRRTFRKKPLFKDLFIKVVRTFCPRQLYLCRSIDAPSIFITFSHCVASGDVKCPKFSHFLR